MQLDGKRIFSIAAGAGLLALLYNRLTYKDISEKEVEAMDAISPPKGESALIAGLDAQLQPIVREFLRQARAAGHRIILTQGRRTIAEQNALYAKGRTAGGSKVTNAKGGESPHNFGFAVDFAFLDDKGKAIWPDKGPWAEVAAFGKALGLTWGGDFISFKDRPHLELTAPFKLARADWKAGKTQVA